MVEEGITGTAKEQNAYTNSTIKVMNLLSILIPPIISFRYTHGIIVAIVLLCEGMTIIFYMVGWCTRSDGTLTGEYMGEDTILTSINLAITIIALALVGRIP